MDAVLAEDATLPREMTVAKGAKKGPKAAEIREDERRLLDSAFRVTDLRNLLTAAGVDQDSIDQMVPVGARLTGAQIAWIRIVAMARGGNDSLALEASKYILDRTYGKASQKLEGSGDDGTFEVVFTQG